MSTIKNLILALKDGLQSYEKGEVKLEVGVGTIANKALSFVHYYTQGITNNKDVSKQKKEICTRLLTELQSILAANQIEISTLGDTENAPKLLEKFEKAYKESLALNSAGSFEIVLQACINAIKITKSSYAFCGLKPNIILKEVPRQIMGGYLWESILSMAIEHIDKYKPKNSPKKKTAPLIGQLIGSAPLSVLEHYKLLEDYAEKVKALLNSFDERYKEPSGQDCIQALIATMQEISPNAKMNDSDLKFIDAIQKARIKLEQLENDEKVNAEQLQQQQMNESQFLPAKMSESQLLPVQLAVAPSVMLEQSAANNNVKDDKKTNSEEVNVSPANVSANPPLVQSVLNVEPVNPKNNAGHSQHDRLQKALQALDASWCLQKQELEMPAAVALAAKPILTALNTNKENQSDQSQQAAAAPVKPISPTRSIRTVQIPNSAPISISLTPTAVQTQTRPASAPPPVATPPVKSPPPAKPSPAPKPRIYAIQY